MGVQRNFIELKDQNIRYTHLIVGGNAVCFMLSGGGYNYDKPLFYYSTMLMLENKIDVVQVHYSYPVEIFKNSIEEIANMMLDDINPVISDVTANYQYEEVILLGKSLGTIPLAMDFIKRESFRNSKFIFLTPLLNFTQMYQSILQSSHKGLLVIGEKDLHYKSEKINELKQTSLQIEMIQQGNHSLDVENLDTKGSLDALTFVMNKIQEVIQ